jgi:hypothetical protein
LDEKVSIEFMVEALTQYYEAAGFKDVYEKELKGKSASEISEMYQKISKHNEGDVSGAPL